MNKYLLTEVYCLVQPAAPSGKLVSIQVSSSSPEVIAWCTAQFNETKRQFKRAEVESRNLSPTDGTPFYTALSVQLADAFTDTHRWRIIRYLCENGWEPLSSSLAKTEGVSESMSVFRRVVEG